MLAGPRDEDNLDLGESCAVQGGIARAPAGAGHATTTALPRVCAGFGPWRPRNGPSMAPRGCDLEKIRAQPGGAIPQPGADDEHVGSPIRR